MPNFENVPSGGNEAIPPEGEISREINGDRGHKSFEAYRLKRLEEINKTLAELNAELTTLINKSKSEAKSKSEPEPKPESQPTKTETPEQPQWDPRLTQEQREELEAEGIAPGDQEYRMALINYGINPDSQPEKPEEPQWDPRLTEEQRLDMLGKGIDEPVGPEYQQALREFGLDPIQDTKATTPETQSKPEPQPEGPQPEGPKPETPAETPKPTKEQEARARAEAEARARAEANAAATAAAETGAEEQTPTAEQIQATAEKAKKNRKLKNILTKVIAGVVAAGIIIGGIFIAGRRNNKDNQQPTTTPEAIASTQLDESEAPDSETPAGQFENAETEKGIYDGYGEKGMWLSEGKTWVYNFANAAEVAEVCDNDECEMIKYTAHNQVESLADYLANMPEELQPEGFKGLSLSETEAKLEELSPEDYDKVLQQFDETIDGAFTRRVKINGRQNNAYMSKKDPNGPVKHENMQLVKYTSYEDNLEVTEFYWTKDGQEIGSMRVKLIPVYDANGFIIDFKGCIQVVTTNSSVHNGLPELTPETPETPDTPEAPPPITPDTPEPEPEPQPEPEPEPEPEPAPKDPENLERIDENILNDIAEDIGTGEVNVEPTTVSNEDITEKPSPEDYQGTGATIVQNEASETSSSVEPLVISPKNNYNEDLGGAHAGEYAPVVENPTAQDVADAAKIPVGEAPTGGQALGDTLGDLGIN